MAKACGARTRSGGECKKSPLNGKSRCKLHGGASTGAPGNQNNHRHGIYGDLIREDDLPFVDSTKDSAGSVDDELLMCRLQLRRALRAQANADALPDGMELFETVEREGAENVTAKSETKKKLRDYPQIIDRLMARIESLEKTRSDITQNQLNADLKRLELIEKGTEKDNGPVGKIVIEVVGGNARNSHDDDGAAGPVLPATR